MQNMNNKALSSVISAVIMILISLTAIVLLSSYVIKTVSLSPQASCTEIQISEPLQVVKACYNANSKDVELTLSRKLNDIELSSISFKISAPEGESEWLCSSLCGDCDLLDAGETKKYYLFSD